MEKAQHILDTPIAYLKGVGPLRAELLQQELRIFTFRDILFHFPFRYVDKTKVHRISEIREEGQQVLLKGTLVSLEKVSMNNRRYRLTGLFKDASGFIELTWFQGVKWLEKSLKPGRQYSVFGKLSKYGSKKSIAHPEMEEIDANKASIQPQLSPVYPSTEKLNKRGLDAKARRKMIIEVFQKLKPRDIPETLPQYILDKIKLINRYEAIRDIHFPKSSESLKLATNRIKFEEFFMLQMRMLLSKKNRQSKLKGAIFGSIGEQFNYFFKNILPFALTGAQKRVLKEIRHDLGSGIQMNRLLQGDVGSGKTIVGLMTMLMALDNGFQCALMAPTEILAQQHFASIAESLEHMDIRVEFLSGSVKGKKRKLILEDLAAGEISILIGTHALIEDPVQFKNLGLAIIDEQHRFGVKQRSRLWTKNNDIAPHILVMTATPIPRTLAMTVYGDLDVSVIDELPPGRKEIKTIHRTESHRSKIISFMHHEIGKGRQIYVVFPLIEESANLDLQNLNDGYEQLLQYFPKPNYQISVVHGRMKAADKDAEMQRFVEGKTQIMVATTVIEVGVNVPNASVMIIENTERFGLSQLHQLRGRVGRGAEQSYCILMSSYKVSKEGKERIKTMVETNDGFKIAEADMRLRGPGNIEGLQQSGIMDFKLLNLVQDNEIIKVARHYAEQVIEDDPNLMKDANLPLKRAVMGMRNRIKDWGRIS